MRLGGCPKAVLRFAALLAGLGVPHAAAAPPVFRLLDLNTTGQSGLSTYFDPQSFVGAGPYLYFPAWSIAEGYELWRSDGTEAGTRLIADLLPGSLSSAPAQLTPSPDGSRLYFLASDASGEYQVYRVEPPRFEATRLTDFDPPSPGAPAILGLAGDHLVFSRPVPGGIGLWAVGDDGAPPVLLRTFLAGPIGAAFGGTDVASRAPHLYFAADDGVHGRELWRTDGTPIGTSMLADVVPGPGGSNPTAISPMPGRVFFAAAAPGVGPEPWVCEPGGARQFATIASTGGSAGSLPGAFAMLGDRVVFAAQSDTTGRELWVTDAAATPGATSLLVDLNPGPGNGVGAVLDSALVGGRLYFAGDDGLHGTELWSTDGTPEGTRLELDLRPGPVGSMPVAMLALPGSPATLVFQAATGDDGLRIWKARTDTGGIDVAEVSDLPFSDDLNVNRLTPRPTALLGETVLFPAFRQDCGLELFASGPDAGSSRLVRDIRPGTVSSAPTQLARTGRGALFSARTELGAEPWVSDGTREGTRVLGDLSPGRIGSNPASMIPGGEFAMFRATVGGVTTWWRSEGRGPEIAALPAGAVSVGIAEPLQSVAPRAAPIGRRMVFAGRTPQTGDEPFVTDGQQTWLLKDIAPGVRSSSPFCFFQLTDRVVFFATTVPGVAEVWTTNGTPEGTELVTTIVNAARPRVVSPTVRPVVAGARLFFVASDGSGDELWTTDGTEPGTHLVADIVPGEGGSSPANLCAGTAPDGSWRLFFSATSDDAGNELWVCSGADGAPPVAWRVADIAPGPAGSFPFSIMADPQRRLGLVAFVATDGVNGFELWSSDGSAAGTRRITDLRSSPEIAAQSVLGVFGARVFFRVVDPGTSSFSGHLFMTDDSQSGASPLLDAAGRRIVPLSPLLTVNSRAFIAVSDVMTGSELGVLDFCPADFDNSGSIGVDDLFHFLAAWIPRVGQSGPAAAGSAADVNGDGAILIQDLFEFLGRFFAGCN